MADYLTVVPKKLLQEIIIKATGRSDANPYVLDDHENTVFTLLNITSVEELPNLVASPLEVAKFVDSLFTHCNPDVLFLIGIYTMFVGDNYFKSMKLVEETMEA
ncbi:hypothetical protein CJ030_MR4G013709 [Morella rubra]|uniref:Uncharacterized protein n=1 Tax=Morella rubra TaxID=262757 RepID=A0A6A1WWP1_9ROSI|nr:hypothetical protein CJ030_MR4G013709 [Morella rubra]